MKRRKLLAGMGGAAFGGSLLMGTGAFSSVEADRSMTVDVVEDPDAYLGLDRCRDDDGSGDAYNNGDYVTLDDGLLAIDLSDSNNLVPGDGVNANAITEINNVFQICNQGTQDVCVWLGFEPVLNGDEEPAVTLIREDDEERIDVTPGREGAFTLPVGECVCFSLLIDTHGISPDDEEADNLMKTVEDDHELVITAAARDSQVFEELPCFDAPPPQPPEEPFYGTSREDPTAIYEIRSDDGDILEEKVSDITDESGDSNYPNGVAFDDANDTWYFARKTGELITLNENGNMGELSYGVITPEGESIAGASFWDEEGKYLYIPNGGDELRSYTTSEEGGLEVELDWSNIGLGDLAIDRDEQILYVSTTDTDDGQNFFSVDLNDMDDQTEIANESDGEDYAVGVQIAFADGTLWAHDTDTGAWYTVDTGDGSLSEVVTETQAYTDLARSGNWNNGD